MWAVVLVREPGQQGQRQRVTGFIWDPDSEHQLSGLEFAYRDKVYSRVRALIEQVKEEGLQCEWYIGGQGNTPTAAACIELTTRFLTSLVTSADPGVTFEVGSTSSIQWRLYKNTNAPR
jgi:hypothetical protein